MKAIITTRLAPTNTRGCRIKASDCDGNRITIAWDYTLDGEGPYRKAAAALCAKMGWEGEMVAGFTSVGYVFVFTGR